MPIYRNPFEKGNLYIKFELTFPPNQFANEKQLKVCISWESGKGCHKYTKEITLPRTLVINAFIHTLQFVVI